ncbi:hypothetical protein [Nocardiopsis trehalosi]|nr:hypothetical protein [Nocardiopsis trehalosi]
MCSCLAIMCACLAITGRRAAAWRSPELELRPRRRVAALDRSTRALV